LLEFVAVAEVLVLELVVLLEFVGGGVTDPVQLKGHVLVAVQSSQPNVTLSYVNPQKHLVQCKPSVAAQLLLIQLFPSVFR